MKEKLKWLDVTESVFDRYGFDDGNGGITARIPLNIAEKISDGVRGAAGYSAGCRIRFKTDSHRICLRVGYGAGMPETMSETARIRRGFTLYKQNNGTDMPVYVYCQQIDNKSNEFEEMYVCDEITEPIEYTLVFPCFSQIEECKIGIDDNSALENGRKYINDNPVIFYGSSITHGCAASNSGNTYEQMISRKYNMDYVNLGFAGNAKGETEMAEYISGRQMCAFVCDYDHNAPDIGHLMKTYPIMYEAVRKKHPNIPYIMISKPDILAGTRENRKNNRDRRDFVRDFCGKAKESGDANVYFIDGETFFPPEHNLCCTVDLCHPNDLGFAYMADKIGSLLAKVLKW